MIAERRIGVHLIHGFNVSDGGASSVARLIPYFGPPEYRIVQHDYGWVGLLRLRVVNATAVDEILPDIQPGDVVIGHSNGALIAWDLVQAGARPGAVVCIQPALRRDTLWPEDLPVLCLYNPDDLVVELGRMWGRFVSTANPWADRHGWGAAGRHGFTAGQTKVDNIDTTKALVRAESHSGIFRPSRMIYWGPRTETWVARRLFGEHVWPSTRWAAPGSR